MTPSKYFLPLRYPENAVPAVTHVRSTAVGSSLKALDAQGLRARYTANLTPAARNAIESLVPGTWLDIEVSIAHYRAIDALGLNLAEQLALGSAASGTITAYLTGTMLRMSREVGLTPWALMPHSQRLWDRMCQGGDISIERVGPKEIIVRMYGLGITQSPYFRTAMRASFENALGMWCTKGYVTELPTRVASVAYREAWV